ncbi:MAG: hypothetical protein KME10_05190 [Plectolyngbya sp. WJT66-NPBG17]|jgi:hypothetical protein|nr:hypothetical protein [Plectolyngbya sp. WJT66-NPBG17]MBW4524699.1 hypothetical protein [Phormidium tanganyikae FI6-MK23]
MLDFNSLFEFSRMNCVGICAFLVPANLLTTFLTLALTGLGRSPRQVFITAGIASLFSGIMVLHVLTWFLIGVVMMPTYILLGLGSLCLVTNLVTVFRPQQIRELLGALVKICTKVDVPARIKFND